MATTTVAGTFSLVYLVFNTIVNLTSQDAQVACFENAAAHLEPGGSFVVEVNVPQLRRLPPGERRSGFDLEDGTGARRVRRRPASAWSRTTSSPPRTGSRTVRSRSATSGQSELDLMARIAGLRLRDRHADWHGAPFTASSRSHVSVWEMPDA